jgi:c-di-GMP-binding flagellar brake protein YcgR
MDAATFPQGALDDKSRFAVHSRLEIVATLRALVAQRAFVTLHARGEEDFIVTAVLAVNPEYDEVVLDYGVDHAVTERLLRAPGLEIVTQVDHIRVELAVDQAEAVMFEGALAFRIPLPSTMIRLQRREYYRIHIPLSRPVRCVVTPDPARPDATLALRIADLSCGGAGFADVPVALAPAVGHLFPDCRIVLPDIGTVTTDLRTVHVREESAHGKTTLRFGAQFLGLNDGERTLIQRYIHRIEREQRARQ